MMRFERASAGMTPALRKLWQQAFGDTDAYLDLFFNEYPAEKFAMAAVDDDSTLCCALYLLPLTLRCVNKCCNAWYVYAVATDVNYRRRGLMRNLLTAASRHAKHEDISALVTVPSNQELFPYYAACGFKTAFYCNVVERNVEPEPKIMFTETTLCEQKELRDTFFSKAALYGEWDEQALAYRDREIKLTGGRVLGFSQGDKNAYLTAVSSSDGVFITEIAGNADETVFSSVSAYFRKKHVLCRTPGGDTPFAMILPCSDFTIPQNGSAALSLVLD